MRKTSASLIVLTILALCVFGAFIYQPSGAQSSPAPPNPVSPQEGPKQIPKLIGEAKATGRVFEQRQLIQTETRLFQPGNQLIQGQQQLASVLSDGVVFDLNRSAVSDLLQNRVDYLTLSLPDGKGAMVELDLVKVDILAAGFSVRTAAPTSEQIEDHGVHYRGMIKGNEQSLAAISVFNNEIVGFFSSAANGNSVIGRLDGNNPSDTHIVYAEKDLKIEQELSCETKDVGSPLPDSLLQTPTEAPGSCIRIYVEADFDLFQDKGNVTNTANYVIALFNQSATLFANDGIPVTLSEILVWNIQSPYAGINSSSALLTKFQQTRTSFNGDFGHLLALRGNGGIAATINGFCQTAALRECFSGIFSTFSGVPTYSWSVEVFTHELGHLLGSFHTHACVWNGNSTAIDGCGPSVGFTEGSCPQAPIPSNGGTIMSYCHLTSVGINFTNGFGPQPRNVITNLLNGAACLSGCGFTVGQGAPNPQLFIDASNRNNFLQFAKLPPLNVVHRWNCSNCDPNNPTWGKGLLQDFADVTPGVHDALMLADTNANLVIQLYGGMWDKFIQLGALEYNNANTRMIGYPLADRNCSDANQSCFTDPQLVSTFATSYHFQRFQGGIFLMHRSGPRNGQTFEVHGPIRTRWDTLQGPTGTYGLPVSDEYAFGNKRRSDFEGGSICFNTTISQIEDNCGEPFPINDNFSNALVINTAFGNTNGTTIGGTKQPGEPLHAGLAGGKSIWYRWTAPSNGNVTFHTQGSNFDTILAAYTGTAVNSLVHLASNDDDPIGGLTSRVSFTATTGTVYRIAIDGFNAASGNTILNWNMGDIPPAPISQPATNITTNSFTANWNSSAGADGYVLDVSTTSTFATFVPGYQARDVTSSLSWPVTGLSAGTSYFYRVRAYNPIGTSGNSATIQANTITGNTVQVTVTTFPSGRSFTVDGINYTSSQNFNWITGSQHVISTTPAQDENAGTRFAWVNWSDGGSITHSVAPTSNITYTAEFVLQHLLTMNSEPGGSATPATGWFNNGLVVEISATPNPGFTFSGWIGKGIESRSGFANPGVVTMLGPITQTARFTSGQPALYDGVLKAPRCTQPGSVCGSGPLLNSRDTINILGETNQPNTIDDSCPDGTSGFYHSDESLDHIRVSTLDGSNLSPGKTVRIDAAVWAFSGFQSNFLDLYYTADAANPNWVYITTVQPTTPGAQVLSATYTIPPGANAQAVRGRFRFQGTASPCGGISSFDDHDDLIFATAMNVALPGNGSVATASSTYSTNYPASTTINGERAGANSTTGGVFNGWIGSTATFPQWVQVDFGQMRDIQQIDVFTLQDNYPSPAPPTQDLGFTLYGLQGYQVQYWNGSSWVTITNGNVTGNHLVWKQFTFPTISTNRIRVLTSASPDSFSRITEIEAWSNAQPPPAINYALPANGGVATASSTFANNYPASTAINGERAGANSTTGGVFNGWIGSTATFPQWLQVDFGQMRSIQEIDVFTLQDNYPSPVTPTQNLTFTLYGLQGYEVQYWNGSSWVTITNGNVTGNNKVWKQFTFPTITTNRIRVLTNASPDSYSRITEVEAWSNSTPPPTGTNVALASNGGVASASSTFANNYPASTANNGERAGGNSTTGGVFNGWIGSTATFPQWLQVDFGQVRNIQEIDVFTVQDNYPNPVAPTQDLNFTLYGLQGYEVQYWNGSSWVTIPNGNVTGNTMVWRQFTFPTISTSKVRVLTSASPDSFSRVTELEAWSQTP